MKNITLKVFKNAKQKIIHQIANQYGPDLADKVVSGMNSIIFRAKEASDYFAIVAFDVTGKVIGYAGFIQNSRQPSEWFYTDLWVTKQQRRKGIATAIINRGVKHLLSKKAITLLCTVSPDNDPSLMLQQSLGFSPVETKAFEFFDNQGLLMFNKIL